MNKKTHLKQLKFFVFLQIVSRPVFTVYQSKHTLNFKANKLLSNDEFVVDLFDISGKQISGKKIIPVLNKFATEIDITDLPKGAYLVRVGNTNFQRVIKAIIN